MNSRNWRNAIVATSFVLISCLGGCSKNLEHQDQSGGNRDKVIGVENGGGSGAIGTPDRGADTDPRRGSNAIGVESPR